MYCLKISNLKVNNGTCDYKGLDINEFEAGSQVYPTTENVAYLITNQEEIPHHADVSVITEDEYQAKVEENKLVPEVPISDRISALEIAMANMMGV